MPSTVVALLAERPEAELRDMRSRLEADRVRIDFELDQINEALSRQTRRVGTRPSQRSAPRPSARPGETQRRILDAVQRAGGPTSPAQIIAAMEAQGATPSRGSIHNTISRLVRNGLLVRLGEGQYKLASQNGVHSDADPGSPKTEGKDPLIPGRRPPVGDYEIPRIS